MLISSFEVRTGTCAVWGENLNPEQYVQWDEWEGCFCECFQIPSGWRPPVLFSSACWWRDPLHWIRMIPHSLLRLHWIWFASYYSAHKAALYRYSSDIRSGFILNMKVSVYCDYWRIDVQTTLKIWCELPVFGIYGLNLWNGPFTTVQVE